MNCTFARLTPGVTSPDSQNLNQTLVSIAGEAVLSIGALPSPVTEDGAPTTPVPNLAGDVQIAGSLTVTAAGLASATVQAKNLSIAGDVAVVSDPERELKVGISSPPLVPTAAVIDPEFALGAPATVGNREARSMRSFALPWIPHDDVILPADVQGMPALGLSDATDPLVEVMNRKLQLMRRIKQALDPLGLMNPKKLLATEI